MCPYTLKTEVLTINSNGKSCIFRDEGYERVMDSVWEFYFMDEALSNVQHNTSECLIGDWIKATVL